MFMDKTSEYAGTYAKENDTLAGSMTTLSAAWENLLSGAGDPEAFSNAIENAAIVGFDTLKKLVPRLWESFKQVASKLYPKVKKALHDFWNNDAPEIAKRGANAVIDGVNAIFGTNIPHIDKIDLPTVEELQAPFACAFYCTDASAPPGTHRARNLRSSFRWYAEKAQNPTACGFNRRPSD